MRTLRALAVALSIACASPSLSAGTWATVGCSIPTSTPWSRRARTPGFLAWSWRRAKQWRARREPRPRREIRPRETDAVGTHSVTEAERCAKSQHLSPV